MGFDPHELSNLRARAAEARDQAEQLIDHANRQIEVSRALIEQSVDLMADRSWKSRYPTRAGAATRSGWG